MGLLGNVLSDAVQVTQRGSWMAPRMARKPWRTSPRMVRKPWQAALRMARKP
jgi:hypothetical protein